jgi:hypothetical protein
MITLVSASVISTSEASPTCGLAASLPFGRLLLALKAAMILLHGMVPGIAAQDERTVAALTDLSVRECCIFDTVNPPREDPAIQAESLMHLRLASSQGLVDRRVGTITSP